MDANKCKEIVRIELKTRQMNQRELSRLCGIDFENVRSWLDDKIKRPSYDVVSRIMQALDLENPTPTAPYVGSVSGGLPTEPWLDADAKQIPVTKHIRDGYVLRLDGDSMNKRIPDGSLMLIDPHSTDFDKKILIMLIDGATSCKYYDASTNEAIPLSYNPVHKNTNLNKHNFQIKGRVVQWFDDL